MEGLSSWEYVPVADYSRPEGMVAESLKGGIAGLWRRLTASRKKENNLSFTSPENLKSLPDTLLHAAVPVPRWKGASSALDRALVPWLRENSPDNPAVFVISPPHGGNVRILQRYSEASGWHEMSPPTSIGILEGDEGWLEAFTAENCSPWVLPAMERIFLRHASGLTLARKFFERLFSGEFHRGIIGCDSWAWAYLKRALPLERTNALVAQAFDQGRLSSWLEELARQTTGNSPNFIQSDDGSFVLPASGDKEAAGDPEDVSDFLKKLAAYSRGIPGVAWALWRKSLNILPEEDGNEKEKVRTDNDEKFLWVTPWDKMRLPTPPLPLEKKPLMIMNALLLHNGLEEEMLNLMLPLSAQETVQTLIFLKDLELLEKNGTFWRVSAVAYPAVRRVMVDEGYLVDEL